MRPSRDNTADAVVSMSRSSNGEAMPDWVAGLLEMDSSKASLVWWCARLSVCSGLVIRWGAVKARLFLVHRHCASLGTNEPGLASLACNCHSAGGASRLDSARCDVAVTCELACQRHCFAILLTSAALFSTDFETKL